MIESGLEPNYPASYPNACHFLPSDFLHDLVTNAVYCTSEILGNHITLELGIKGIL